LLLAVLTLLMSGLAIYSFIQLGHSRQALALAQKQVLARDRMLFRQEAAIHRAENDSAAQAIRTDTVKVLPPAAAVFADELGSLTGDQLSDLMKAGLPDDPEAFLRHNLQQHQAELLTGKAHFTDIRILTPSHALAAWADDHRSGYAVLHYEVKGPGNVSWKTLGQE
jgi:hypothetical protein